MSDYVTDEFVNEVSKYETYMDMICFCKRRQSSKSLPIEAYNVMGQVARSIYLDRTILKVVVNKDDKR